ncbi:hypothetical protein DPMN_088286 [Dreissena polymorpha]|uniref:Uncharacterized protein n=1 Tax=Dreissena polymorpha TaxID=45954 RepID=A0A9D4KU86_DREPO|nr:hypothetical protein DPMN_088286 [Dreissena polymorpha]
MGAAFKNTWPDQELSLLGPDLECSARRLNYLRATRSSAVSSTTANIPARGSRARVRALRACTRNAGKRASRPGMTRAQSVSATPCPPVL